MHRIVRRRDGRYMGRIQVDGRRYTVYGRSEAECREKLVALERDLAQGQPPVPGTLTVREWLEAWFAAEQGRWKARTKQNYRTLLDKVVLPRIGQVRLARMTPVKWQRFLASLEGRAASHVFAILRRAGNVAVRWRWLPDNPMNHVVPPRYQPARRALPPREDLVRLFQYCCQSDDPAAPLVGFTLATGLRLGEVAALEWGDIDERAGLLHVRRSGQWLAGRQWVVGPPKSPASQRTIPLGPTTLALLERQRQRLARAGFETPLVFPRPNGQALSYEYASEAVRRLCRKAGVPELRFHDLRHAVASLALGDGCPLPEVSRFLGHSSTAVTASIYAHALRNGSLVAASLERTLTGW